MVDRTYLLKPEIKASEQGWNLITAQQTDQSLKGILFFLQSCFSLIKMARVKLAFIF